MRLGVSALEQGPTLWCPSVIVAIEPGGITLAKYDVQSLSYKELRDLHARISDEIETRKQAEKSNVQQKVMQLVQSAGFELDDIVGNSPGKSLKGRKIPPKYRNPKKPEETWTGRGRQPKWLAQELARGRSLKSFLIK